MTKPSHSPGENDRLQYAVETERQDAVHRILNLLFVLNASRIPLSTSQILDDEELGYSSSNRESAMKQFKRDRQKLEKLGIVVIEVKEPGASEREESSWAIDQERTHAVPRLITADDADLLASALADHLSLPGLPYRLPLERITAKLTSSRGLTPPDLPESSERANDSVLESVWTAFSLRLKLTFEYENARGEATKRTVCVYGLFSIKGVSYLVGLDEKSAQIRTFRIDRIKRAWKPKGVYAIPADFDVTDFLFFTFDFEDALSTPAAFLFPPTVPQAEIAAVTHGRGALSAAVGGVRWDIDVRDLDAAAGFCLEHAQMGMMPLEPQHLIDCWRDRIAKAVQAHA